MVARRLFKKFMNRSIVWTLIVVALYCVILFIFKDLKGERSEMTMEKLELLKDNANQVMGKIVKSAPQQKQQFTETDAAIKRSSKLLKESIYNQSAMTGNTVDTVNVKDLPPEKLCPNLKLPQAVPSPETWQPVDESRSMYVFSAYYNTASRKMYVTGVRPENNVTVFCQSWRNKELIDVTESETQLVNYRGFKYTPTTFQCPVNTPQPPTHVSLVLKRCWSPSNVLNVIDATTPISYKRRLTICLPPLVSNFSRIGQFMNWVEINKLFGAEKFVIYKHSVSDDINRLINHYATDGLVDVVTWSPPMVVNILSAKKRAVELENFGETVALNDCLYRNKKYSEFISNNGVNEYLIPHTKRESSLVDVIGELSSTSAAYFVNMAFIKKVKTNTEAKDKLNITSIKSDSKKDKVSIHTGHNGNKISKLLIRTSDVGFTLPRDVPGIEAFIVPPEKIVLHKHPGIGQVQMLGSEIDKLLPKNLINKVNKNIQNIWTKLETV